MRLVRSDMDQYVHNDQLHLNKAYLNMGKAKNNVQNCEANAAMNTAIIIII